MSLNLHISHNQNKTSNIKIKKANQKNKKIKKKNIP